MNKQKPRTCPLCEYDIIKIARDEEKDPGEAEEKSSAPPAPAADDAAQPQDEADPGEGEP